jgi:phage shock protein PspC (stress-responsive transcriptional regulator)
MKKVININFQGRVVPIEEPAYEELRRYIESLRVFFEKEEGKDEIINDIENRIAELFSDRLKRNAAGCVTESDVSEIIASMGRPEQFDGDVSEKEPASSGTSQGSASGAASGGDPRGSFYRNNDDKVLGGVCSGLAAYLKIDPTIVRLLFALVTLGGFGTGFLIYIVLWIVLPPRDMGHAVRRRLYRNPDDKVIGGVCSGLSSYFKIPVWLPRLVFVLPLAISILVDSVSGWGGVHLMTGSFAGTMFLAYIILWIVIPFATTPSEKLEMRGERIDLESIKNSVQGELQGLNKRMEGIGKDIESKVDAWGKEVNDRAGAFSAQAAPVARRAGNGLGHAIGVLFKAFFLFIAGILVFALFITMIALLLASFAVYPLKDFLFEGFWHNVTGWGTLLLFLAVPVVALVVWFVRRIAGIRSSNNYLSYIFGTLWFFGWVSVTLFAAFLGRQFKRSGKVKEEVIMTQPSSGRLTVMTGETPGSYYPVDWIEVNDDEEEDLGLLSRNGDSLLLSNVAIRIGKSPDSNYRTTMVRMARGETIATAEEKAAGIGFDIRQTDSLLTLPKGFPITKKDKFRSQRVLLQIEVPVGKAIRIDAGNKWYDWYEVTGNRRGVGVRVDRDYDWEDYYDWDFDEWYIMTESGLERMYPREPSKNKDRERGGRRDLERKLEDLERRIEEKIDTMERRATSAVG